MVGADIPATTSNCSGVQFGQGLNAGHTVICATPPTFGASGGSHSVGYVPDPGSSAGTTRFLREDATWVAPAIYNGSAPNGTYYVTSDFNTTSGSLVNIPGLSWTMPANAATVSAFSCQLIYSEASANIFNFGIQDVTIAPTNIAARAEAFTSTTAVIEGNVPALTTTTATNILTATDSVTAINLPISISGLIEQPSNASSSAINIMVSIASSATLTVKRGSFCRVF